MEPPVIVEQPASASVMEGQPALFSIVATGQGLNFQWRKNGVDLPGAHSSAYQTPPVSLADDGAEFTCEVSNIAGSVTSAPAVLTVIQSPPVIVVHPKDLTVDEGHPASFSVVASGSGLQYQWYKSGIALEGATFPDYTVSAVAKSDNGSFFTCNVSNEAGSITSNPAILTVTGSVKFHLSLISIGASAAKSANGETYRAEDIVIGSNANGIVEGQRFRLFLK